MYYLFCVSFSSLAKFRIGVFIPNIETALTRWDKSQRAPRTTVAPMYNVLSRHPFSVVSASISFDSAPISFVLALLIFGGAETRNWGGGETKYCTFGSPYAYSYSRSDRESLMLMVVVLGSPKVTLSGMVSTNWNVLDPSRLTTPRSSTISTLSCCSDSPGLKWTLW